MTENSRSAFVSYSEKDERYRERLDVSLVQLRRNKLILVWHDRKILPGQEWDREIDKNLESADIVMLLVSPDFLASDYAYSREMLRALERHQSGSATVVPIILRPSDWQYSPLASLQALPSRGRPVSSWPNRQKRFWRTIRMVRRESSMASATPLRLSRISVMPPASMAAAVPEPMAMPRSACASAGASLMPSPTMATRRPPACNFFTSAIF